MSWPDDEQDELRGYGEYRGVLTPERPKQARQGLTQLRPHLRQGEQLTLMVSVARMSAPKATWLGVTTARLLLVNSGRLTFDASWDDVALEPLSSSVRVHHGDAKPFKITVMGGNGANLEGLLAVCHSHQEGTETRPSGARGRTSDDKFDASEGDADAFHNSRAAEHGYADTARLDADQKADSSIPSLIDSLRDLGELHADGVLTDDEFATMKARLLEGG